MTHLILQYFTFGPTILVVFMKGIQVIPAVRDP